MAKTLLDLDENLLAEAAATLGTKTKKDTVTLALQKVSEDARSRRASALEDLLQAADADVFDYDRLAPRSRALTHRSHHQQHSPLTPHP